MYQGWMQKQSYTETCHIKVNPFVSMSRIDFIANGYQVSDYLKLLIMSLTREWRRAKTELF